MEDRNYTEHYIAYLDILGFREQIKTRLCEEICVAFDSIKKPFKAAFFYNMPLITHDTVEALNLKIMSDSICFYTDASTPGALSTLLMTCIMFQINLYKLSEPIFLRGAIVRGDLYVEKDRIFGPGLVRAYTMEEKTAKNPRIVFTKEVFNYIEQDNKGPLIDFLNTMIFRDHDALYTLNPIKAFLQNPMYKDEEKKKLRNYIEKILDTTEDNSIREKYLYLEKILIEHRLLEDESYV